MSDATLVATSERIIAQLDPSTSALLNWHAGEPTTVPLSWYRFATELFSQSKRGVPLQFSLQTNGIGLNDEWVKFLIETKTDVGISIDGPEDLHDAHRRTRGNRGTWQHSMAAFNRLRRHGIEPNVITKRGGKGALSQLS
jgi:uncharacterized protein